MLPRRAELGKVTDREITFRRGEPLAAFLISISAFEPERKTLETLSPVAENPAWEWRDHRGRSSTFECRPKVASIREYSVRKT